MSVEGRGVKEVVLDVAEGSRGDLGGVGTTPPRREDREDKGVSVTKREHPTRPRTQQPHHHARGSHAHSMGGEGDLGTQGTHTPIPIRVIQTPPHR